VHRRDYHERHLHLAGGSEVGHNVSSRCVAILH
jgi:hypothetical protein